MYEHVLHILCAPFLAAGQANRLSGRAPAPRVLAQDYTVLAFLMSPIAISVSSRLLVVMSSTCAERSMEKIVAVSNATTTMLAKALPPMLWS